MAAAAATRQTPDVLALGSGAAKEAAMIRTVPVRVVAVLTLSLGGCSTAPTPTSPTSAVAPSSQLAATAGTHGKTLTALVGNGTGTVNVTPTAAVDGSFSAQINVNVHGAPPNTTLYVQRAPEIGRANGADGICQRAAGEPPWGPPAPNFVTFPLPAAGPLVTLETSAGGAGAAHIDFAAATILDGTQFDVMFRLVDSLTTPTVDLRTACFTVTVK
jgi:hypothetical protein